AISRAPAPAPVAPPLLMPPSARQMDEGYWLGARFEASDVQTLSQLGIRVVLSAVRLDDDTLLALHEAGIRQVNVFMGDTFRHADVILAIDDQYPPEQIFIHCTHGADRTGATAAFLLVSRHGWSIPDALYAVVYPSERDVEGLGHVLQNLGFADSQRHLDQETQLGRYSLSGSGVGVGGMKARNERYARLVYTAVEAMQGDRI
ncbi:MAG: hypothetical protein KC561_05040, partial [Myxococcales bacterium]|nr:hypothetical protein [Myxococcales bacterium]